MNQNKVITTNSNVFPNIKVFRLRDKYVMLASDIAKVFDRRTSSYVQNFTRHQDIFDENYAFQTTKEEDKILMSLGVTSSGTHGGNRKEIWVVTRKGLLLSIAKMNTKKAMKTFAIFIDVLDEVLEQLYHNQKNIEIVSTSKLLPKQPTDELEQITKKIYKAVNNLLNTVIDTENKTTVRDEIGEIGQEAISHVKEWLKGKKVSNEKVEAETVLILEQVRDISERRYSELKNAALDREQKSLEILEKRIEIVEKLMAVKDKLEPNTLINLVGNFREK
ncbi:MAG: ORF6N domain-containing protein [Halarcobacter sp.]